MQWLTKNILPLLIACILSMASVSHAGWVIKDKLNAFPALAKEKFGCSVATDGNWLAVGASDTAIVGFRSTGAVHLFERVAINGFCGKQYFIQLQARIKRLEIPLRCDKIILSLVHGAAMDIREVCLYSRWVRMVVGHLHPL